MAFNLQNTNKQKESNLKPVIILQSDRTMKYAATSESRTQKIRSLCSPHGFMSVGAKTETSILIDVVIDSVSGRSDGSNMYFCEGLCRKIANLLTTTVGTSENSMEPSRYHSWLANKEQTKSAETTALYEKQKKSTKPQQWLQQLNCLTLFCVQIPITQYVVIH